MTTSCRFDEKKSRAKSEVMVEHILESASEIISTDGLLACTHRAVAAQTNISPGTITYHFKTLDDLHAAVIKQTILTFEAQAREWFKQVSFNKPELALTNFLIWTLQERQNFIKQYELFIAAVSKPRLRAAAREWLKAHKSILQDELKFTSSQAESAVAITDAWLMRCIITEEHALPDINTIKASFASITFSQRDYIVSVAPLKKTDSLWLSFYQ